MLGVRSIGIKEEGKRMRQLLALAIAKCEASKEIEGHTDKPDK